MNGTNVPIHHFLSASRGEKKTGRKKLSFFCRKNCHPKQKQFLLKVLLFSGVQLPKVYWGYRFCHLSDLQVISALCTSGRTVYSNCQLHSACDLQVKKARFGLVWCGFILLFVFNQVSPVIKFL